MAHDLNLAYQACEHWLVLSGDGRWETGPRESVADPAYLSHVFGHRIERLEDGDGIYFVNRFVAPTHERAGAIAERR